MNTNRSDAVAPATRRAWVTPSVTDLPRLTQLTLTTTAGPAIPGGLGGGSTIIP
jgi:hypothetical protein